MERIVQEIHLELQTRVFPPAATLHQHSSHPTTLDLSSQTSNRVLEASQQVSNRVLEANRATLISHRDRHRGLGASKDMPASRKASIRVLDTSNRVLEMETSSRALEVSLQVSSKAILRVSFPRGALLLEDLIMVRIFYPQEDCCNMSTVHDSIAASCFGRLSMLVLPQKPWEVYKISPSGAKDPIE